MLVGGLTSVAVPARAVAADFTGSNYYGDAYGTTVILDTNSDTNVTIYGTNLQSCHHLYAMGGGWSGDIPVTPASDGLSASFVFNDWSGKSGQLYGWALFDCGNPGNFFSQGNYVFPSWGPTRTVSATSELPGGLVTIEFSGWDAFYDVSNVTFDGVNVETFTRVSSKKLTFIVPDGVTNSTKCIKVTNFIGESEYCPSSITQVVAAPGTPGTPTVVRGDGKVTVTPVASGSGGTPTSYLVTSSPGGFTCTVTLPETSCDVTGLSNGTAYTFTATATNSGGTSGSSNASSSVTPQSVISTSVSVLLSPGQWLNTGDAVGISAEVTASSGANGPTGTIAWSYCYDENDYPTCNFSNDIPLDGHSADLLSAEGGGSRKSIASISNLSLPNPSGYYMFLADYSGDSLFSGEWNSASLRLLDVAPGVPGTPTGLAGDGEVELSWSAPSTGTAPFSYTITSSPAGASCAITLATATCTGLTNGTEYTFKVTASNGAGSQDSLFSSGITPVVTSSGGSASSNAKSKPLSPNADDVNVTTGSGSLIVGTIYSGSNSYKPSSYTVKVSPGGSSCVIQGSSSSCEVIGLKTGVEYTVSISATNRFGTSSWTVLPSKYILTDVGLLGYESKKTLPGFAGGSAKLTKAFKITIKKYINSNTGLSAVTCTGYTAGKPVLKSDKSLAKARAKAVCVYVEKIRPALITTIVGKTPGLAWGPANRKVVIRGYSAIG